MITLSDHQGREPMLKLGAPPIIPTIAPADREAAKRRQQDATRDAFFDALEQASGRTLDARAGTTRGKASVGAITFTVDASKADPKALKDVEAAIKAATHIAASVSPVFERALYPVPKVGSETPYTGPYICGNDGPELFVPRFRPTPSTIATTTARVLDGFKTDADYYGTTVTLSLMVPRAFREKHPIGDEKTLAPILRAAADRIEGIPEDGPAPSQAIATLKVGFDTSDFQQDVDAAMKAVEALEAAMGRLISKWASDDAA